MRNTSRIAILGLSLTIACALALAPRAKGGSTTGNPGTSHTANTTGSDNAASSGTAQSKDHYASGGGLLCAALLESGILGDVFTVAPVSGARREDPGSAIQFAPIWSDSHQATVGDSSPVEPTTSKPAVAIIKLPISFSEADRQKFAAAGWRPHRTGALGISYCLNRAGPSGGAVSPVKEGMICVTAAP